MLIYVAQVKSVISDNYGIFILDAAKIPSGLTTGCHFLIESLCFIPA
jgi:hypothetical protein|nr:hypothetical protein [Bacteroides intestinalis]